VFANSSSVHAYSSWSLNEASRAASGTTTPVLPPHGTADGDIPVKTTTGDKLLPSLVTPRSAQGKRIRSVGTFARAARADGRMLTGLGRWLQVRDPGVRHPD